MTKYIFIGDLHGASEVARYVCENFPEHKKVFIGDYLDSFDRDADECVGTLKYLLAQTKEREDVVCLLGNHEVSYLLDGMQASGWNVRTAGQVVHMKQELLKHMQYHYWVTDDILCTHAGCTAQVYEDLDFVRGSLNDRDHPRHRSIGYSRGGRQRAGGLFWCDFWAEFQEIKGITQIVGHSAHRPEPSLMGIVCKDNCWNIDCLQHSKELLEYDTETKEFNTIIGEWDNSA